MGRIEELEYILTSDEAAQERSAMTLEAWAGELRDYFSLRRQREQYMSKQLSKVRGFLKDKQKRRQQIEDDLNKKVASLKMKRKALGGQVVAGGDLSELTGGLSRLQEEVTALSTGLEVARQDEQDAELAVLFVERQEALEQAQEVKEDADKLTVQTVKQVKQALEACAEALDRHHEQLSEVMGPHGGERFQSNGDPSPFVDFTLYQGGLYRTAAKFRNMSAQLGTLKEQREL